ncbi:hypothetical protein SE17_22340, partial [Kouleothrix aurantiaca]
LADGGGTKTQGQRQHEITLSAAIRQHEPAVDHADRLPFPTHGLVRFLAVGVVGVGRSGSTVLTGGGDIGEQLLSEKLDALRVERLARALRLRVQVGLGQPHALLAGGDVRLHQVAPAAPRFPPQRVTERAGRGIELPQGNKLHCGGGGGSFIGHVQVYQKMRSSASSLSLSDALQRHHPTAESDGWVFAWSIDGLVMQRWAEAAEAWRFMWPLKLAGFRA